MKNEKLPVSEHISRTPLPGSKKVYVQGTLFPIQVAMREIGLSDTTDKGNGIMEKNAAVTVYDTSGPFTDPNVKIDLYEGINRLRQPWVLERGDVEELAGNSSEYTRSISNEDNQFYFKNLRKPLRAKKGHNVSQLHYA